MRIGGHLRENVSGRVEAGADDGVGQKQVAGREERAEQPARPGGASGTHGVRSVISE